MDKFIAFFFPFYMNRRMNKKLRDKISSNDDIGIFNYMDDISTIELESFENKFREVLNTKDKLEDKAKLNVAGITIAITLIMGSTGLLEVIYNKYNSVWFGWVMFALLICGVAYMLIAGIMAIKVLIDENEVYTVGIVKSTDETSNAKLEYKNAINKNAIKNLIRNNSVFTSYECIRNALACLFLLFIFVALPIGEANKYIDLSSNTTLENNIYYSAPTLKEINEYNLEDSIESVINEEKDSGNLSMNGNYGLISDDKKLFITVNIQDNRITIMNIEIIDDILN
jgi:hypothetical protein